jgi:hypothetical protein
MANEFVARRGITSLGGITLPYTGVSSTYTINTNNYFINCTSGTFTVTLPTAVGITGQTFIIKNSGAGTITVATTGGQSIDGTTTKTLTQYGSITVQSNGSNWSAGASIKTINNQSLVGTGNVTIATPRSRIVGQAGGFQSPIYTYQINFGAIAFSTVIDIDIQCTTYSNVSGVSIKLYASTDESDTNGAIQLATYSVPTGGGAPQSGRFIRRFRGWNYTYDSEGETFGGNYIETLDPNLSSLNDFSPSGYLSYQIIGLANTGTNYNYLIAKIINPGFGANFASWVVEYGD